jgi:hypothetical protein
MSGKAAVSEPGIAPADGPDTKLNHNQAYRGPGFALPESTGHPAKLWVLSWDDHGRTMLLTLLIRLLMASEPSLNSLHS